MREEWDCWFREGRDENESASVSVPSSSFPPFLPSYRPRSAVEDSRAYPHSLNNRKPTTPTSYSIHPSTQPRFHPHQRTSLPLPSAPPSQPHTPTPRNRSPPLQSQPCRSLRRSCKRIRRCIERGWRSRPPSMKASATRRRCWERRRGFCGILSEGRWLVGGEGFPGKEF